MRQSLVCEQTLAKCAMKIKLGDYLNLGVGEESGGGRTRTKILADAMEALIAAVYLDSSSPDEWKTVILRLLAEELTLVQKSKKADYKTRLQQIADADGATLEYKIIDETGPEHNKRFCVVALVNNNEVGRGEAGKIQRAEVEAAKCALGLFGESV